MVKEVNFSEDDLRETRRKLTEKLKGTDVTELKVVRTFAKGAFAHLSLVHLEDDPNTAFALKAIQKAKIKARSSRRNVFSEKRILYAVQSDFIVKLYGTFKNKKFLYFLTEYCPGGDLDNRGQFPECAAKFYMACVLEAIDCLHSMYIVHNDIKPANIVLDSQGYAKLIDMGLAEKLEPGKMAFSLRGTINFLTPEVVCSKMSKTKQFEGRDRATDLWALGVLLYKFLADFYPFQDLFGNNLRICMRIARGIDSVNFSEQYFSEEAIDLIRKLCALTPKRRIGYEGIEEIRKHPWFENFDWIGLRKRELRPPILPNIENAFDTQNFKEIVPVDIDAVEEDDSDWDMNF